MNDQDRNALVDNFMRALNSTVSACVDKVVRAYAPKECVVSLWASETAAYIGQDTWMSRDKALATVWKRTNEAHMHVVQNIWRAHGGCLPDDSNTGKDVRQRLAKVFDPFPHVATIQDVEEFRRTSKASDVLKLYKAKGQVFEETLATEFSKTVFQPIMLRNTSVIWSSTTQIAVPKPTTHVRAAEESITDPGPFQIVGEVDGWLCSPPYENTIVEFKLRCSRISDKIPFRDYAQVQTYLHVHDIPEAMYVQGLLGSREMKVESIGRDERVWQDTIFPGLQMFVCDVRRILRGAKQDLALQSRVLASLTEESHKAAPMVHMPIPRSSSTGSVSRKNTFAHQHASLKPDKTSKRKTSSATTPKAELAFLPPEYKPSSNSIPVPIPALQAVQTGYNTRSKKRQRKETV